LVPLPYRNVGFPPQDRLEPEDIPPPLFPAEKFCLLYLLNMARSPMCAPIFVFGLLLFLYFLDLAVSRRRPCVWYLPSPTFLTGPYVSVFSFFQGRSPRFFFLGGLPGATKPIRANHRTLPSPNSFSSRQHPHPIVCGLFSGQTIRLLPLCNPPARRFNFRELVFFLFFFFFWGHPLSTGSLIVSFFRPRLM